jgi:hypothetical protein
LEGVELYGLRERTFNYADLLHGLHLSVQTIKLDFMPPHILEALFSLAKNLLSASLRCSDNLSNAGVEMLANSLSSTNSLTTLHLDYCHLSTYQLNVLSRVLPESKVSDLLLKNSFPSLTTPVTPLLIEPLVCMCVALENTPNIARNFIGQSAAFTLVSAITNSNIKAFNIAENRLGAGALPFFRSLNGSKVKYLDIRQNNLSLVTYNDVISPNLGTSSSR